jgi:hypothetical protein
MDPRLSPPRMDVILGVQEQFPVRESDKRQSSDMRSVNSWRPHLRIQPIRHTNQFAASSHWCVRFKGR